MSKTNDRVSPPLLVALRARKPEDTIDADNKRLRTIAIAFAGGQLLRNYAFQSDWFNLSIREVVINQGLK